MVHQIKLYSSIIVFLLLTYPNLTGQHIESIKGIVVDDNNHTIPTNVLILSSVDSTLYKGESFLDSVFLVSEINKPEILVKITALSYHDVFIKVKYDGKKDVNLGTIVLQMSDNLLSTVTITGKTPMVKYSSNGTVEVNVANTILSASSSLTEILSKSPNIIENNGQISVIGKGDALIYLNGKLITNERLSSIPVSQIVKIEIISNPSAKYDAEGRAVINVITKSTIAEGILARISQQLTYGDFGGGNSQSFFDLSYGKSKFSLTGNYSLLTGNSREYLITSRERPNPIEYMKSNLTTDWQRKLNNYSNYSIGTLFQMTKKASIALSYNGYIENLGGKIISTNDLIVGSEASKYLSQIDKDEIRANHSLTANYNKSLDSLGSTWFVGTQYSLFNSDIDDFITETRKLAIEYSQMFLKNVVDHNIHVWSTQTDYTKIWKGNRKLELGAKLSYVNTGSATDFLISTDNLNFQKSNTLSNDFGYIEKVPAAYISYSGVFNQINFGLGLRGELTDYILNTSVGNGQKLSDTYFNVFPSFQVNRAITKNLSINFSYSSRITRPRYQALNPFVVYQDPFTTMEGNPNLIPEKTHAFEIGTNLKSYDLKLGYNYTIDPLNAAALRGNTPNSFVLKGINLHEGHSYFISLSKSLTYKGWNSVNTANLSYTELLDDQYDFNLITPKPQIYLYTNNTYTVGKLLKLQLLGWYSGRRKLGLYDEFERYNITVGIEKDFLDNKLKLRVLANDIFSRTHAWGKYSVGQANIFYNRTFNNSYFRAIATYNIGKLKNNNFKIKSTGQTENSRAI